MRSEVEPETRVEGPLAREFGVERQRVQFVIAVRDIQHTDARFSVALPEAVAGEGVQLPEIIADQRRRIVAIVLRRPDREQFGEETTTMRVRTVKLHLMRERGVVH